MLSMSVQPGQTYRNLGSPGGPQIITVDSLEGDQVHGSYTPASAPEVVGASTWHISVIEAMELVSDA